MPRNVPLTVLAAQQKGAPLPTVTTADEQSDQVNQQLHESFVARAAGWGIDSDGDTDDD